MTLCFNYGIFDGRWYQPYKEHNVIICGDVVKLLTYYVMN